MIESKNDLKTYLREDRKALGITKYKIKNLVNPIYQFKKTKENRILS